MRIIIDRLMHARGRVSLFLISLDCAWTSSLEKFGLVLGFVYNDDRYYGVDD